MEMDFVTDLPDDADLLRLVGDAIADVPSFVMDWGRHAYTWHSIDAELDYLLRSSVGEQSDGPVRGPLAP